MKFIFSIIICMMVSLSVSLQSLPAAQDDHFPVTPTLNNGQKWRIAYYQGGDYGSYQKSLIALAQGLMRLGWIEKATPPAVPSKKDTKRLWQWLSGNINSDYLEFVADAGWDAHWNKKQRQTLKNQIIKRLNEKKDLDLVLAMGTWAGQDLATDKVTTPTLVCSTTDPIASGIIKSAKDSGLDHLLAKVDPDRHKRQVRLFHKIFHFNRLGVVYEDSPEGIGFSAVNSVFDTAKTFNFSVVPCQARFKDINIEQAEQAVNTCYAALADKVDAVYIVRHPGVNLKNLPNIMKPLNAKKIPTFAQGLSDEVAHGVLLSISLADFSYIGDFYANTIARILNGARPRKLTQTFQNPPKIAINLETARLIGYDPSVDVVGAADEIFTEIATDPK